MVFALSFTKIVLIPLRTKILIVLQILGVLLICCGALQAQEISVNTLRSIPADTSYKQITNKPQGSTLTGMLPVSQRDSTQTDSIKPPREPLTAIVKYSATDYSKFDRRSNKLYLYNEAEINYTDINIKAGQIIVDNTIRQYNI